MVFDLGGRNAKVTILKINYKNEEKFDILSNKDEKLLGEHNFDNKLVDYFLNRFCEEYKISLNNIRNKKDIKKLKIACENVKKFLSIKDGIKLEIPNFYEQKEIFDFIRKFEFEELCKDIFEKLTILIKDALNDAKINKNEINEIILVGGSSKIRKIKLLLKELFEINYKKERDENIINDFINPDEVISYGATLMAKNILYKSSEFLYFNIFDIIPFSLGINIKNESKNPEIKKEGDLMKVIMKTGTKIPCTTLITYKSYDNIQKELKINIFQGEEKYVKYNNLLGEIIIKDLPKKRKELLIYLNFFIDANGILTIIAKENNNLYQIEIKSDMWLLSQDNLKIKEKYEQLFHKEINKDLDFINLKEILTKIKKAYEESEDDKEKYEILKFNIGILELFANLFDKKNVNETLLEKYYIYSKELINLYIKILNMKKVLKKSETTIFIEKIIESISLFINSNSGYLNDLIEMMKILPKQFYTEIIVIIIEKLNESGKNCLKERNNRSLAFFEKAYFFYIKYDINLYVDLCRQEITKIWRNLLPTTIYYINAINENEIPINENNLKLMPFFISENFRCAKFFCSMQMMRKLEEEKNNIILNNNENILMELSDKICKERAICIANIIKISRYVGKRNYRKYYKLGKDCEFIVNYLKLDTNEYWYKEFKKNYQIIKEYYNPFEKNDNEYKIRIKETYKEIFEEIELQFIMRKNDFEFIKYILYSKPYEGYEKDLNIKDFNNISNEIIDYLRNKYNPYYYNYSINNEKSLLNYFIFDTIKLYLDEISYYLH